jgi:hypothetical protein
MKGGLMGALDPRVTVTNPLAANDDKTSNLASGLGHARMRRFEGRWRRPSPLVMLSELLLPWLNLGDGSNLRKIVMHRGRTSGKAVVDVA